MDPVFEFLAWCLVYLGQALLGLFVLIIWAVMALVVFDEIKKVRDDFRNPPQDDEFLN